DRSCRRPAHDPRRRPGGAAARPRGPRGRRRDPAPPALARRPARLRHRAGAAGPVRGGGDRPHGERRHRPAAAGRGGARR
ncbi:MAG: hypothetical protein AVDCRST_MAG11-247, partial [uncultured Gemmatimonadaceae bacterium]